MNPSTSTAPEPDLPETAGHLNCAPTATAPGHRSRGTASVVVSGRRPAAPPGSAARAARTPARAFGERDAEVGRARGRVVDARAPGEQVAHGGPALARAQPGACVEAGLRQLAR